MLVFMAGRSAVLTRSPKLTKASSVGESTIGDILLRVSLCLVVLNKIPAEHFLFPYRTEPLTPLWTLCVTGSNQALQSSVTTGLCTAISCHRVSRTAPLTTPSSPSGVPSRSSSGSTTGAKTTSTTSHSTCSRRGASRNEFHRFCNSITSSLTWTGTCAMYRLPLPAPPDHTFLASPSSG